MTDSAPQQTNSSPDHIARNIRRASWLMIASIVVSRVIGFAREWVLAHALGASAETDVYLASFTLPDLLNFLMAAGTMSLSLIPLLAEYRARGEEELGHRVYAALLGWFGSILIGVVGLAEIFAHPLARWIAPGFSPAQNELLVHLLRIIFPAQLFFYAGSLGIAVQQTSGRFLYPALAPIVYNAGIVIFGVCLHRTLGVAAFSVGVLAGSFCSHGLLQTVGAYRLGFGFRWVPLSDRVVRAEVRRYVWLTLPLVIGLSVVVADEWFSKYVASQLETKALSWLSYARIEMRIPVAILGQAAGVASFPYLARLWSAGDIPQFSRTLWREVHKLIWLAPLAALFLYQFAEPLTYFLYGGGRFTSNDLAATARAAQWMSAGVCFWTVQVLLVRGLYAAKNTWWPSIAGFVVSVSVFPLYPWLGRVLGQNGVALAGVLGIATYVGVLATLLWQQVVARNPQVLQHNWNLQGLLRVTKATVAWIFIFALFATLGKIVHAARLFHATRFTGLAELACALGVWGACFFLLNHYYFRRTRWGSLL